MFLTGLGVIFVSVKKLSLMNNDVQQSLGAAGRVFEVLDAPVEVRESPSAVAVPLFSRQIEFRDVSFRYDHALVLDRASLAIRAGEMVALVGPSGAGKTTLVNLLPRFYDVSSGAILIDGVDIRNVSLASLRRQIGIVTQDTVLFDDTVATNIAYGSPGATRQEIEGAARAANAHD